MVLLMSEFIKNLSLLDKESIKRFVGVFTELNTKLKILKGNNICTKD